MIRVMLKNMFFQEMKQLRESLFGITKPIPLEDYLNVHEKTGLDIDGRRDKLQSYMYSLDACFRRSVDFIKVVPGVRKLPTKDQIALCKGK